RLGHAIQVDPDADPGFARAALHLAAPRKRDQLVGDRLPVPLAAELPRAQLEGTHPQVPGEGHVGVAVANHCRARPVDTAVAQVRQHQPDARLAGGRALFGQARVDQYVLEDDALAFQQLHQQAVRGLEVLARERRGAEAVLIADHHQPVAGVAQPQQRRQHAGHEAQLVEAVDLEVGRLLDQGAVAVDEEDRTGRAHAAASAPASASSTRRFCPGVPTVMRSASSRPGTCRWSRTTTPAPSSRSNASAASVKRTSRKLPEDGYTVRTTGRRPRAARSASRPATVSSTRSRVASSTPCSSACNACSTLGAGNGYGAWQRARTRTSAGSAITLPSRSPASAWAFDSVRSTARL